MKRQQDLARLRRITDMVLDAKLAELRAANLQRRRTQTQIDLLAAGFGPSGADIADALAALQYQKWAEARRSELGQVLARQTAVCLDARDAATLAYGKSRGLDDVAQRLRPKRMNFPQ